MTATAAVLCERNRRRRYQDEGAKDANCKRPAFHTHLQSGDDWGRTNQFYSKSLALARVIGLPTSAAFALPCNHRLRRFLYTARRDSVPAYLAPDNPDLWPDGGARNAGFVLHFAN